MDFKKIINRIKKNPDIFGISFLFGLVVVVLLAGFVTENFFNREEVSMLATQEEADNGMAENFEKFDSDIFSFRYPSHLVVHVDTDGVNRVIMYPKDIKETDPFTAIIISIAENDEKMAPVEWLLSPQSGFEESNGYFSIKIDGQDAVYTDGGMWTVANTPDNRKRLSIAYLAQDDAEILSTEMGIVIKTLKFIR